jgi:O-antigen ligase
MAGVLWITILRIRGALKPTPREACIVASGLTLLVALTAAITVLGMIHPKLVEHTILSVVIGTPYRWTWIAAFLMTNLAFATSCNARRFHAVIGGVLILVALCTTLLHAAGIRFIEYTQVYSFHGYYRPHGILLTPLEAGLVGLLGWAWGLAWSTEKNAKHVAGLFLTGLSTATVYLTFSRSAWVGIGIAMLVGLLWTRHYPALWKPLLVTLITFALCSVELPTGWQRGIYAAQGDKSVLNRLATWSQFPAQLIRYPFGVTEETADTIDLYMAAGSVANFYLDVGFQDGVLPFVLTLCLVGLLLSYVWRCGQRGSRAGIWGLGIVASTVCLVFMNPSWDSLASALWGGFWGMVSAMEVRPDATTRVHTD